MKYEFRAPYPTDYQVDALKQSLAKSRFGIFFAPRVGKTRVAVDYCGIRHLKYGKNIFLIVTTKTIMRTWEEELLKYLPHNMVDNACIGYYPKTESKRAVFLKQMHINSHTKPVFIIASYDTVARYNKPTHAYVEVKRLTKLPIDTVIFDESHLIKNPLSRRNKAMTVLCSSIFSILLLTGTPMAKAPHDIYGQFKVMNPTLLPKTWAQYRRLYCRMGGYMGKEIIGVQNADTLMSIVHDNSMRLTREEANIQNAVSDSIVVPIEFEPSATKKYVELKTQMLTESDNGTATAQLPIVRITRLQQMCGGFLKLDTEDPTEKSYDRVSHAKTDATVELVKDLTDQDEAVVIFYRYLLEGDALYTKLTSMGIKTCSINGKTTSVERNELIKEFQACKYNVALVQIATGCMGISFDRANNVIFYSLDYSLSNKTQAEDRVQGRFQMSPTVTYYYMAIKGTIDYRIMKMLQKDENVIKKLMDDWRNLV